MQNLLIVGIIFITFSFSNLLPGFIIQILILVALWIDIIAGFGLGISLIEYHRRAGDVYSKAREAGVLFFVWSLVTIVWRISAGFLVPGLVLLRTPAELLLVEAIWMLAAIGFSIGVLRFQQFLALHNLGNRWAGTAYLIINAVSVTLLVAGMALGSVFFSPLTGTSSQTTLTQEQSFSAIPLILGFIGKLIVTPLLGVLAFYYIRGNTEILFGDSWPPDADRLSKRLLQGTNLILRKK